jgi:hypothetical protein
MPVGKRWLLCDKIVEVIGLPHVTKTVVFARLSEILERDMDDSYWANVTREVAREDCSKLFPEPMVSPPAEIESPKPAPKPRRRAAKNREPAQGRDAVRLAHWFIDHCVDALTAKRAFDAAYECLEKFEAAQQGAEQA